MKTIEMFIRKRPEDDYDLPEELAQLTLNRPKAVFSKTLPDSESRLSLSLFGQAFDELHFLAPRLLRIAYSHPLDEGQARTFKVRFEGEGGDDYGGLYREVWSNWSSELMATTMSADGAAEESASGNNSEEGKSPTDEVNESAGDAGHLQCILPLLHPVPNRLHGVGSNRENFILRPSNRGNTSTSGSGAHLLLEATSFLGQLMGIALRTRVNLPIDLASIVWRTLAGEDVGIEDLRDMDHSAAVMIETFLSDDTDPIVLEAMCEELRWAASLSDGSVVELYPGGAQDPVLVSQAKNYAQVLLQARLRESEKAVGAVRDGLASVIPAPILPLFTGEELERLICGTSEVDVELLKQMADYDDELSESDEHIQSFWRVLTSFNTVNRSRFLRFVWARSRLPGTKAEFSQRFKLQAPVGEGPREDPDSYLPKSATCFFALSLPRYSSDEVMRTKLLYAITNCESLDADFRLADNEHSGWDNLPGGGTGATPSARNPGNLGVNVDE